MTAHTAPTKAQAGDALDRIDSVLDRIERALDKKLAHHEMTETRRARPNDHR